MFDYESEGAQKFINPVTVPSKNVLTIYRDDPRNNDMYKATCGMTVVVLDEDTPKYNAAVKDLDLSSESIDPQAYLNVNPADVYNLQDDVMVIKNGISTIIAAPSNLYVDPTSYQLEDATVAGDGTVRWVASLYFDDVAGAVSYEYVINAEE